MDPVQMGKFLARLRREAGLTQEALGQTLGVTNKTVSRWENGNYLPDLEMLQLLGARFDVSVDELICGGRRPAQTAPGAQKRAMTRPAAALKQTDRRQPGPEQIVQPDGTMPKWTAPGQTGAVQTEAEQAVPPQADATEAAASPFALRERIAYWKQKWLREHIVSLVLCYVFLCVLLPVAARALGLSGNLPFLLGSWSLLTLVFYITARNRMMIYIEARAFLP